MSTQLRRWMCVLTLAALGTGCVENGLWLLAGTAGRFHREGAPLDFQALNFRYLHPGRPWFDAFDKPAEAHVALMRLNPGVNVVVYAWEGDDPTQGSEQVANSYERTLREDRSVKVLGRTSITLSGQAAEQITVERVLEKQTVLQEHVVLGLGGFGYHLLLWAPVNEQQALREQLPELLARFRLLDPHRVSSKLKGEPYRGYASTNIPFAVEWTGAPWRPWPEMRKDVEEAETGALSPDGDGGFVSTGILYAGERPRLEALQKAAFNMMGFAAGDAELHAAGPASSSPNGLQQQEWMAWRSKEKNRWYYRALIQSFPDHAVITWAWSTREAAAAESRLRKVTAAFKHGDTPVTGETPAEVAKAQAFTQNQVGLFYFEARQYQVACRWFGAAQHASPDTAVFLRNAVHCLHAANQHQDAVALVKTVPDALAQDAVVRSWLAWNLSALGERERALQVFDALLASGHRDDDDLEQYANLLEAAGQGAKARAAWEGYMALHGSADLTTRYSQFLFRHKEHTAALDMLQRALAQQYQPALVYAQMSHLSALERHKEVIEAADQLVSHGYASAESYASRGRAEYRLRWHRKAKVSFEKSLALDPSSSSNKEWLDAINAELGQGSNSAVKDVLQPVSLPAALLAEMKPAVAPRPEGESASYDWRVDAIEFERDKVERTTLYRRVHVLDEAGVSRFSTLNFNFDPDRERIFVNRAVVLDAAGQEVAQANVDDSYVVTREGRTQASNEMTLEVPIPRLARGLQLEFVVTRESRGSASRFSFHNIVLVAGKPSEFTAVYFKGDPKQVRHEVQHASAPVPVEGGLLFSERGMPAHEDEPWNADAMEFEPSVRLVDARAQWKPLVEEYLARIKPAVSQDAGIPQLAKDLTRGMTSPEARIAALLAHVHQRVTYRAIEFGSRGTMPVSGSKTLEQGYGDCKDHAVLLLQMLKGVGIHAVLALVHTTAPLAAHMPSLDQFNHMIVYIPSMGRFLDPTDRDLNPSLEVPAYLGSKSALLLEERATVMKIPAYARHGPTVQVERTVSVEPQGTLQVEETVTWRGYYAAMLRGFFRGRDEAARQEWLEGVIRSEASGTEQGKSTLIALDDVEQPLQARLKYVVPRAAAMENGTWVLQLPLTWERHYLMGPMMQRRKTPFTFQYPFGLQAHTRVAGPSGAVFRVEGDAALKQKNATGGCNVVRQPQAGGGAVDALCEWEPGTHPPVEWRPHQELQQHALDHMASGWRMTAPPAPAHP